MEATRICARLTEHRCDYIFVLFPLQRTRGVDHKPSETNGAQCRAKDGLLAFSLTRQILRAQAMTNFRIAAECTGAAAGHVRQHYVVSGLIGELCRICEPALDAATQRLKPLSQLGQPLRARFAGHDARCWIALSENQGLATGRSAAVQNRAPPRRNLGNQLRSLVLQPHAVLRGMTALRSRRQSRRCAPHSAVRRAPS